MLFAIIYNILYFLNQLYFKFMPDDYNSDAMVYSMRAHPN